MKHKIKQEQLEWTKSKIKGFYGKELIAQEKGSVKLVRIDPVATYPEHLHPSKTEYAHIIEGNPIIVIENQHYTSKPGDFYIFPVNTKHAIINNTSDECLLLIGAIEN
ncbi:quercetin dioxygenase-like cupin family protein [Catalinimonas alkaloidigena]|uniref:cupin domain-containing protein n=1 Tax=Catalinimonas alkaloidigena TaxID=1075417 RepID=UPI0024066C89|nr:cupin domain-containing protein [Catalinimonas alkaloidigena]MDF9801365.1 quercetin dioxygenase-like cupin family protein [Catalinimonas alkaloidigena]